MSSIAPEIKFINPQNNSLIKLDIPNSDFWDKSVSELIQNLCETCPPKDPSFPLKEREISIRFSVEENNEIMHIALDFFKHEEEEAEAGALTLRLDGRVLARHSIPQEVAEDLMGQARTQGCALNAARHLSNGNEYEFINFQENPPVNPDFWNPGWKKLNGDLYDKEIYPLVIIYLEKLLPQGGKILELCSGDGQFAEAAFETLSPKIGSYHLIDLNEPSSLDATKRLEPQIKEGKASVQVGDIVRTNLLQFVKGEPVDMILGIGALTKQVLPDRETALHALDNAVAALKPNGRMILTGLADHWISSEDLSERGFVVENTSSPYSDLQFYVAVKM